MELKRSLGLLDVFCVASGAMISSGLFILPGIAYVQAGPAVALSYLLAGLLAMTGMLSEAELVSAMPKAGGSYFYVTRAMGPAVGTVDGLLTWLSLSLKTAFALIGMAAFTSLILDVGIHVVAAVLCLVFVTLNIVGVRHAGRTQVALVTALIGVLVFYIIRGLPAVSVHRFEPFAPHGMLGVFSTAGLVFVSYGGLLKVTSIAEEVKDAGRVGPLGMTLSLLVVGLLYVLVVFVTVGVLGNGLGTTPENYSTTPISDGAAAFMGRSGRILLSIAAILAFVSTANAGIMAAARYPLALSRDDLLPKVFGKVHRRFKTPYFSIIVTGAIIFGSLWLKLPVLAKAASTVLILTFVFSCLSVIILRESRLQNYQPQFRAPLYPWLQIVGIGGLALLVVEMGLPVLATVGVLILAGLFVYWFYGRIRTTREFALLHLIERITARELTAHMLETELKEIIRERDEITIDRFDRIIENCTVLDIEERMTLEEFFERAAGALCDRLGMKKEDLLGRLRDRERESSTALTPTLAIPHVIIDGEGAFDILLARCREGVEFSESAPGVHAIFVIAGTRDERNFHLKALAAIAQIVQHPRFEERWLRARDSETLRDIILLGQRPRA